ncbi:MAG: hypothetical protein FJ319_12535 [SAR202 cluster bacterium]|nr:hypothetical protein [SAR202 cluster bacterium]
MRPYAVLRAGFPYLKTLGNRMLLPTDVAIADDGMLYVLSQGSHYSKGKPGPITIPDLNVDHHGSFGWRCLELPVKHCEYLWPCQIVLDSRRVL